MSGKVNSDRLAETVYLAHQLSQLGALWVETEWGARRGLIQVVMYAIDAEILDERSAWVVHVHFGFFLRDNSKPVWDCVVSEGESIASALRFAIDIWCSSMGRGLVELLRQDGTLATRYRPHDQGGVPGWHSVVPPPSARFVNGPQPTDEASVRDSLLRFQQSLRWDAVSAALAGADPRESYGIKWLASDFGDGMNVSLEIDGTPVEMLEVALHLDFACNLVPPFMIRQNAIALFPDSRVGLAMSATYQAGG